MTTAPVVPSSKLRPDEPSPEMAFVAEVEQQFRVLSAEIHFVTARVLRRVLRNELEITSPLIKLPHRKLLVIERDRLLWLVNRDELGAAAQGVLPARLILIARPEEDVLQTWDRERLLRYYWQLVFHARLDFYLQDSTASSRMSMAKLRERIDRIGQSEFDEIRSVLRQESMLLHPEDLRAVYAEYVAVYFELATFTPDFLSLYFPSQTNHASVRAVIEQDCPADQLLTMSTPVELRGQSPADVHSGLSESALPVAKLKKVAVPSERRFRPRMKRAQRFHDQGNTVRAALWFQQAIHVAPPELLPEAREHMQAELDTLSRRLQVALELTDELTATWRHITGELANQAGTAFWNANIRLLYDLQKVCLSHERETYRIDFWQWLARFGRQPLKRPLPNQRIVLMSKHLASATRRLGSVQLQVAERKELSHLLHESAAAAERLMRRRMEPFIAHSLHDTGFVAKTIVEEVAIQKMVQELLDGIVNRGFITLGDLRDAVSQNQQKMDDLSGQKEFLSGDALLQADQRLALLLDGVYQKGPFYLRWLQRLSSLFFGTQWGRCFTLYAALPYGVAFMAISGAEHLVEMFHSATGQPIAVRQAEQHNPHVPESDSESPATSGASQETISATEAAPNADVPASTPGENLESATTADVIDVAEIPVTDSEHIPTVAPEFFPGTVSHGNHQALLSEQQLALSVMLLGTIIFVLMHFPNIRAVVVNALNILWTIVRWTLYDLPLAVVKFPIVAWLLRSLPVMLFRRYLLTPIVLTALYWKILPGLGITPSPSAWMTILFFSLTIAVFFSRLGRETEELFWDWLGKTWYRVRVHLIAGIFTLVVDVFRQVMDGLERVLYAVDEWLRFRKGESNLTLGLKAALGAIWSIIHAVIRFAVTLLIEPQINPIKHFPVVTVSHKLLLPLALTTKSHIPSPLASLILLVFKDLPVQTANTIAATVVFGIPGIFGFLAWEFKENWRLYVANRPKALRPVRIGSHGETLLRLLCPGFHSGTIPKLFAKRRRNARKSRFHPERDRQAKFVEQLHHVTTEIHHFVERELFCLLKQSRAFGSLNLSISDLRVSTNRLVIEIQESATDPPCQITISEQSGWLIAGITQPGWIINRLDDRQRRVLHAAIAGIYKLGGVELVREQIESQFIDPATSYDIAENGLVVWPHRDFEKEITYSLMERPLSNPRPRSVSRLAGMAPLPLHDLVFNERNISWEDWQTYWEHERTENTPGEFFEVRLLPLT